MAWTTKLDELRTIISDSTNDRLRHRKRVFGLVNGTNVSFKTFEGRRITNLTTAVAPLGVYVDSLAVSVTADDIVIGEFNLSTPPIDGQVVEATYYAQWFLDNELSNFLLSAAQWLQFETADDIPPGLRPAAIHYCAQEAYMKLSLKWSEHLSEVYRLEDAPKEGAFAIVDSYQKAAMAMHKKSMELRDDFYANSGRNKQPSYASVLGRISGVVPKR